MGFYDKNFKFINKYGSVYDIYGAITLSQIFADESITSKIKKREGAPKGKLRTFYKCNSNACVAAKIYYTYFNMIVKDALDGDIIQLSKRRFPVLHVGLLPEEISEYKLKLPVYPDLDYRKLKYRMPRMLINYGPKSKIMDRVVHLPKALYFEMLENIKNGKQYTELKSFVKKTK